MGVFVWLFVKYVSRICLFFVFLREKTLKLKGDISEDSLFDYHNLAGRNAKVNASQWVFPLHSWTTTRFFYSMHVYTQYYE